MRKQKTRAQERKPSWPVRAWRWYWKRRRRRVKKPPWAVRLLRRRFSLSPRAERIIGWIETIVEVGVLFWLIITFVTVRMTVPTGSMFPSIVPGDSFFVDIISYHFRSPTQGSIVVFWFLEELQITRIKPRSPAEEAGLKVGDYIVAPGRWDIGVGGEPVPSLITLSRRIIAAQGGSLEFKVLRISSWPPVVKLLVKVPVGAKDLDDLGIGFRTSRSRYVKRLVGLSGQEVWIGDDGLVRVNGELAKFLSFFCPTNKAKEIAGALDEGVIPDELRSVLVKNSRWPSERGRISIRVVEPGFKWEIEIEDEYYNPLTEKQEKALTVLALYLEEGGIRVYPKYQKNGIKYGTEPTVIPEEYFFVLGDNTMNSYDSRYWGFVPKEEFIGCPFFRVWPFSRFGPMNGYFWSSLF